MKHNIHTRNSVEKLSSHEGLPVSDRIVVYGTRLNGAEALTAEIRRQLDESGLEDMKASYTRDAAYIDDSFYEKDRSQESLTLSSEMAKKPSIFRRLVSLVTASAVESDVEPVEQGSVPRGVIILPHMRQYTPSGSGMTITTPYSYIEDLCSQHEVPFVRADRVSGPEDVSSLLQQLNINSAK